MVKLRQFYKLSPRRIALGYAGFGVLWVGLSDRLVLSIVETESGLLFAQRIKGWIFVGLSAALIFGLTRMYERQVAESETRALSATEQFQVLHRIFRHNIRNELTAIHGYAELLLDRSQRDHTEQWAHRVIESAGDLLETSEKLGIVNEVDFGSGVEEPIDVVPIIEHEVEQFRDRYPEAHFRIDLPDRLEVFANTSFEYAIHECLENAMEHHSAPENERHVAVRAEGTMSDVTVEITDDGPGISPDEVAPVEAGSEGPLFHGSGVGLWIISWLCRSFNGSVGFDGGNGTTVRMTLEQAEPIEHVTDRLPYEIPTAPGS